VADPNVAIVGSLDPSSWRNLQRDLKRLAPEIQKELNKEIKGIAGDIVSDAKSSASWSSRIPGALAVSVTTSRVGVKVNRKKAPHARAFEGVGRSGFGTKSSFRHPVFGNRNVWVSQPTRPFLAPAIRANQTAFFQKAEEAVTNAARHAGWR
jgi:hypothetical protein